MDGMKGVGWVLGWCFFLTLKKDLGWVVFALEGTGVLEW
jgi:hypothetical protein